MDDAGDPHLPHPVLIDPHLLLKAQEHAGAALGVLDQEPAPRIEVAVLGTELAIEAWGVVDPVLVMQGAVDAGALALRVERGPFGEPPPIRQVRVDQQREVGLLIGVLRGSGHVPSLTSRRRKLM